MGRVLQTDAVHRPVTTRRFLVKFLTITAIVLAILTIAGFVASETASEGSCARNPCTGTEPSSPRL